MRTRLLLAAAAVAAPLVLGACASPATPQAMTVQAGEVGAINARLKGNLGVASVSGGRETNPLWASKVDDAAFRKALEDSLARTGYLAAPGAQPGYQVSAELVALKQPMLGLTFEVTSEVNYRVTGQGVDKRYPVVASGVATTSDAMIGTERLRIANERSILENIRSFLRQLSGFSD